MILHVNSHRIRNREPEPISVRQTRGGPVVSRHNTVKLKDKTTGAIVGEFVYDPDNPLPCGAKLYFQSDQLEVAA